METQASLLWPFTNICQRLSLTELAKTSSFLFSVCWPWVSSIPFSRGQLAAHHETCGFRFGWAGDKLLLLPETGQGKHTWCQVHGHVDPGFRDMLDMQLVSLQAKRGGGGGSISLPTYYAVISLGKFSLVERNGLGDKINIPFVLLVTPAVGEIMLFFFFENGNCQYAVSITHLVYSFFFGF